jgi:hypothetical protein
MNQQDLGAFDAATDLAPIEGLPPIEHLLPVEEGFEPVDSDALDVEPTPVLPHLSGEFLLWLWWTSEQRSGVFELGDPWGTVELWVDSRLVFEGGESGSATVVGENPAVSLEAKAAVAGGKMPKEIRFGMRRDDREFLFSLRGPMLDLASAKVPQVVKGDGPEALFDRMYLYEELYGVVAALLGQFARVRTSVDWSGVVAPDLRTWVGTDSLI